MVSAICVSLSRTRPKFFPRAVRALRETFFLVIEGAVIIGDVIWGRHAGRRHLGTLGRETLFELPYVVCNITIRFLK